MARSARLRLRHLLRRPPTVADGADDPAVLALFDADHYARQAGVGPRASLAHHLSVGWRLGLDPHPLFSTDHYLAHSRDVARADMCPLVHYARHGAYELRSPHPLFDAEHYAEQGDGVWDDTIDPLRHYLEHNGRDGRRPNAWFDSEWYAKNAPDVTAAGVNPLVHYATFGWREGRRPHPDFDVELYLRTNPDVAEADAEPLAHFLHCGVFQGRIPSSHAPRPWTPRPVDQHGSPRPDVVDAPDPVDATLSPTHLARAARCLTLGYDFVVVSHDSQYGSVARAASVANAVVLSAESHARRRADGTLRLGSRGRFLRLLPGPTSGLHDIPLDDLGLGTIVRNGGELVVAGRGLIDWRPVHRSASDVAELDELGPADVTPRTLEVGETALSVVVGTVGDAPTLPAVLTALEHQRGARTDFEVVVVSDGPDRYLETWADGGLRRAVVHPWAGVAGRLNVGLFLTASPLVLFLADDEVAEPDLVIEHRRAHARFPRPETAIVGRTGWASDVAAAPLATWMSLADDVPLGYPGNARCIAPGLVHLRARQLSVERSFLVRRGVFDPSFERFHDVELGIRLQLAGIDLRFWSHARSSRLGPCDLDRSCGDLAADGPELVRVAAADPSGRVAALCGLDGAAGRWRRAQPTFDADRTAARVAEAEVVDGGTDVTELFDRYHDLLWASRSRGLADALDAPRVPRVVPRPVIVASPSRPPAGSRRRALVVGVVLGDRPNTAAATAEELAASRRYDVEQRWVVVGRASGGAAPARPLPDRHVAGRRSRLAPKYEILADVLTSVDAASYDHVLVVDDDVDLPSGFLDAFLDAQRELGFVLAQPARSMGSPADHPIVVQQPGSRARRTLFVEQGPVLSIDRTALDAIVPFDLRSPMGWGYECVWSHRLGDDRPIGIIDATPVDHRLRPTAAFYSKTLGEEQSAALLAAVAHRPLEDCMRILEVHPLAPSPTGG